MDYEFVHDPANGNAKARFSLEHEAFGPWLEGEIGKDVDKLTRVLSAIDNHNGSQNFVEGSEYSLSLSHADVTVQANASMDESLEELPEELSEELQDYDQSASAACGIDDFREMLVSWSRFITR